MYGNKKVQAQYALQKLIIRCQNPSPGTSSSLLFNYATQVNVEQWRPYLIEALAIINAGKVLRKVGFPLSTIKHLFLPHITSLSVHIDPVLKTLYQVSEQMSIHQASKLILHINENHKPSENHLRFYDNSILEVYLLDWLCHDIISTNNVDVLLNYCKQEEWEEYRHLLLDTIRMNCTELDNVDEGANAPSNQQANQSNGSVCNGSNSNLECYNISREHAGYLLIINNERFYSETNADLMVLYFHQ